MAKILSICIPSFNMEKYLARCIDSLIIPSLKDLEIIIVNDGSTDGTLKIATELRAQYGDSIVVLDKPNGHYGSTVNAALKIATGKYFRILDADDWFDTDVLEQFVQLLSRLDVDAVYTNYVMNDAYQNKKIFKHFDDVSYGKILDLNHYQLPDYGYAMHALTYCTQHLRDISYRQSEGICYTDSEYVYYPLSAAHTFYAHDAYLYQYFIGREDQSVSLSSSMKFIHHRLQIVHRICCEKMNDAMRLNHNYDSICSRVLQDLVLGPISNYLLKSRYERHLDASLRTSLSEIQRFSPTAYRAISSWTIWRFIPYVSLWLHLGKGAFPLLSLFRWRYRGNY